MKVIAKPIEMLSISDSTGDVKPIKFRMKLEDKSLTTIKVDRIIRRESSKRAGEVAYIYTCESLIQDELKLYELRYTLSSCIWVLYKM
jgi:hypothetical protein